MAIKQELIIMPEFLFSVPSDHALYSLHTFCAYASLSTMISRIHTYTHIGITETGFVRVSYLISCRYRSARDGVCLVRNQVWAPGVVLFQNGKDFEDSRMEC
jgi:hypothetical protein